MIDWSKFTVKFKDGPAAELAIETAKPCSLCRVVKRSKCPHCNGTEHEPVRVMTSCSTDELVSVVRRAEVVPRYILVPTSLHISLLADKTADRMLGAAGVLRIDNIGAYAEQLQCRYADALAHINRARVCVQRPLVPSEAGWTDDDVFVEAYRLGWEP